MITHASAFAADLLIGSTIMLGFGTLVVLLSRTPVHRQRAAELAVVATLAWLVLALAPLPRRARPAPSEASGATMMYVPLRPPTASAPRIARPPEQNALPIPSSSRTSEFSTPVVEVDHRPGGVTSFESAAPRESTTLKARAGTGGGPPMWVQALLAVYALGALAALAHVSLGVLLVRRLVARTTPAPSWLSELFESRRAALGVRRCRLRLTGGSRRPLSAGMLKPTVVLPATFAERASEEELRCVIDHELVHVARGDVTSRFSSPSPPRCCGSIRCSGSCVRVPCWRRS